MSTSLAEYVYAEEIAAGASPDDATIMANGVVGSPAYMLAWIGGRAERLRGRKEQEEELLEELGYPGNPCLEEL